jgi:predicted TPR repeat methyltransferase
MRLPELTIEFSYLYDMLFSPIRLKLLLTSIELKVFNYLSEPKSADELASIIQTHPGNTKALLDGLAAIDLVEKKKGIYQNTAIAQTFLVERGPTYLGVMLNFMSLSDAPLENLTELVKSGPPPQPDSPTFSEEMFGQSASMMANIELAGDAQQMVRIVSELPEFFSFRRMLDLGGGPGLIGMAIVDAHPKMKGVIFDLPAVVKVARNFIEEFGMEDRVEILGGNYNCDSIGEDYDLVVTCNSLQFASDINLVLKKIFDALNPGGVLVSLFGFGRTHEGTKPENLVLGILSRALMGQDIQFDEGYIADAMVKVGFKSVRSRIVNSGWGSMELDVGRK